MTAIILLGPPGAGKGTQASIIACKLGIPAISTGEIFRANIAEQTELGILAQSYMDRGELVPDSVINPMVHARLKAPDAAEGFLLDGYPRTVEQAHALRDTLADLGTELDVVIELQADEDQVVHRMLKRATERHRSDDTEPVIRHRLAVYHTQTEPVATYYVDQDLLEAVDANGSVEEVSERIFAILDSLNGAGSGSGADSADGAGADEVTGGQATLDDPRDPWFEAHQNGEGECCGAEEFPEDDPAEASEPASSSSSDQGGAAASANADASVSEGR